MYPSSQIKIFSKYNLILGLSGLLLSSIIPFGSDKIGGILLVDLFTIIGFVELGEENYRGYPTKLIFTIGRYFIGAILTLTVVFQAYFYITQNGPTFLSIYALAAISVLTAYIFAFKPSDTSIWEKALKVVGYALILLGINDLQNVEFKQNISVYPYFQFGINWGMLFAATLLMVVGYIIIKIVHKHIPTSTYSNKRSYNQSKVHEISFNRFMMKTALSLILIGYAGFSMLFMDSDDDWSIIGAILIIPCWLLILLYYLPILWNNEKVNGSKILMLPLLQKINLFKTYSDTMREKIALSITVIPFLVTMFVCPMLTSMLYVYARIYSGLLILILLIPPLTIIISLIGKFMHDWFYKSENNEN